MEFDGGARRGLPTNDLYQDCVRLATLGGSHSCAPAKYLPHRVGLEQAGAWRIERTTREATVAQLLCLLPFFPNLFPTLPVNGEVRNLLVWVNMQKGRVGKRFFQKPELETAVTAKKDLYIKEVEEAKQVDSERHARWLGPRWRKMEALNEKIQFQSALSNESCALNASRFVRCRMCMGCLYALRSYINRGNSSPRRTREGRNASGH